MLDSWEKLLRAGPASDGKLRAFRIKQIATVTDAAYKKVRSSYFYFGCTLTSSENLLLVLLATFLRL